MHEKRVLKYNNIFLWNKGKRVKKWVFRKASQRVKGKKETRVNINYTEGLPKWFRTWFSSQLTSCSNARARACSRRSLSSSVEEACLSRRQLACSFFPKSRRARSRTRPKTQRERERKKERKRRATWKGKAEMPKRQLPLPVCNIWRHPNSEATRHFPSPSPTSWAHAARCSPTLCPSDSPSPALMIPFPCTYILVCPFSEWVYTHTRYAITTKTRLLAVLMLHIVISYDCFLYSVHGRPKSL